MDTEKKALTMANTYCSQNEVLKEPAVSSLTPTTGSKSSEQWSEVETGYYEIVLDFEPTSKPKVVLPPITNDAFNASAFQKLQDRLEKAEADVKSLKEGATQYDYAPQLRTDPQMRKNLSTEVNTKLNELRNALQQQFLRYL